MCLQCATKAEFIGELVSGVSLYRSVRHHEDWPMGTLGLVFCNDPSFVIHRDPPPEPDKDSDEWFEWAGEARDVMDDMWYDGINAMVDLIEACKESGWERSMDGNLELWLAARVGRLLAGSGK